MALLEGEQRYERFGQFILPAVQCRAYLSLCLAEVGAFAEGIAVGEEGLHIASHSRRRRMPLKINDLSHSVFVNIKPIESRAYAFYAVRNAASFELNC